MPPKLLTCIGILYKAVHKIGRLRKFNHARENEYNFLTAWTIAMKLGTLVHYRKRGSASYIVREVLSVRERERYRERERDGSDVIFALKLAMNSHFHLPKIRTIGDELTLSLAKNRTFRFSLHTSRFSLHGEVTIVALKFAMISHFPLPKMFSPSLFPLFQMARAARRVIENLRQMIKSCPVLFCSSHRKTESN